MRRFSFWIVFALLLVAGVLPVGKALLRAFEVPAIHLADGEIATGRVFDEPGTDGARIRIENMGTIRRLDAERVERIEERGALGFENVRRTFFLGEESAWAWSAVGWTVLIALLGTLGAVAIGLPFAVLTARTDMPGGRWFAMLYAAPLVLPPLLMAMAWDAILPPSIREGPDGWGRWPTVLAAAGLFALAYFPCVTLFARRSLASAGASLEEAARLHAGPWRAFRRVTLPLAMPGVALGALFAFVFALNDFSLVDYLNLVQPPSRQVSVVPWLVQFNFSRKTGSTGELLATTLPVAIVSLVALGAALRLAARGAATVGTGWRRPARWRLPVPARAAGFIFCALVLVLATIVPVVELLIEAGGPGTYRATFGPGRGGEALQLTIGLAIAAVLLAVPMALVLAEAGRRVGRLEEGALGLLAFLPLALTPALLPIGALDLWNRPWLEMTRGGGPWNPVYDTALLPALVVLARVLPFTLAATWASAREIEPSLLEAGEVAGVPWDLRLRRLLAPLARPGIVLGGLLAFVFAVRELDALSVLKEKGTLLLKLWAGLHYQRDAKVAAMAVVLVALLALAFAVAGALGWLRPRTDG